MLRWLLRRPRLFVLRTLVGSRNEAAEVGDSWLKLHLETLSHVVDECLLKGWRMRWTVRHLSHYGYSMRHLSECLKLELKRSLTIFRRDLAYAQTNMCPKQSTTNPP
jgi:hypothetical protein